jgi:hypothetical protein
MEFMWFWCLLGVLVLVIYAALWLSEQSRWHLRINHTEVLILTPWGGIWIADNAFDVCMYTWWSGVEILRRVPGSVIGRDLIYRTVYKYETRAEGMRA